MPSKSDGDVVRTIHVSMSVAAPCSRVHLMENDFMERIGGRPEVVIILCIWNLMTSSYGDQVTDFAVQLAFVTG